MGEHMNQTAILPEGAAEYLTDGVEISTARKPWQAPYMIRSTLATDTESAGANGGDNASFS